MENDEKRSREDLEQRLEDAVAELVRTRQERDAEAERRQAAEEEARQAETRFMALVQDIPVMLVAADKRGAIVLWNRECERVTGYTREQAFEYPGILVRLFPDEAYRSSVLREGFRRSWAAQAWELEITCRDGGKRTIAMTAASQGLYCSDWGACVVGIDVTERVVAAKEKADLEAQLHRTHRMESIGRLAGGVAHDFNNLLTAILCATEGLAEHIPSWDPRNEDLEEVRAATRRAADLTRELLAFSSKQDLAPVHVDLGVLVTRMKGLITQLVGTGFEVVVSTHDDVGVVLADPAQMQQVVMNLAMNAREAMSAGGLLSIEVYNIDVTQAFTAVHGGVEPGPYVVLIVSDTGVGIDADLVSRVFEPFFTTKDQAKGMGLATVYGIVTQSGGRIVVESDLGIGTTFEVYFPRIGAGLSAAADLQKVASPPPQGRETVLLVEDDDPLRRLMMKLLEKAGYVVLAAGSVAEAVETVREHSIPIHLVVTDVVLPGGSGRDVIDALAKDQPHLRALYVSGYPLESVREHGVGMHSQHFLHKPFTPAALLNAVRAVLAG